ncbi:hypothetical protein [Nakamurella deserti]|uniref:hypothetical protein n=1 Tax=Nakamurella deserti TaxID=2164074 RepID=UPI0013004739|nr:hypothetical protein [Nakamurella deserti]
MSRRPGPVARSWLVIAAVAATVSLGLPWKNTVETGFGYTFYGNGLCHNSYDADGWMTTVCDPYWTPRLEVKPELTTMLGIAHPVRALLLLTVVMVVVGYRRGDRRWLVAAPAPAAVGITAFGVTGMAGQSLCALALGALLVALRRDGVFPSRRPVGPVPAG